MKKKILFISRIYDDATVTGGSVVTKRNHSLLVKNYDVDEINLDYKVGSMRKIYSMLSTIPTGFTKELKDRIFLMIDNNEYDFIWIDGSWYGDIVKQIKMKYREQKLVVFFHNVELNYYKEKVKVDGGHNYLMVWYSYINERKAIKYADKVIMLNERDSCNIKEKYSREADLILPLSLEDRFNDELLPNYECKNEKTTLLFVGSYFYANIQGIKWFVKNVLPYLDDVLLEIVGFGMEKLKEEYKDNPNIIVKGFVEDIGEAYSKSDIVIAPIFHGSGMKTKTTEALMYGKSILGTTEAFEGFDLDFKKVGALCIDAADFINEINRIRNSKDYLGYNSYSREVYISKYCNDVLERKVLKI